MASRGAGMNEMRYQILAAPLLALVLGGCVSSSGGNPGAFLLARGLSHPTPKAATYCSNHGCQKRTRISLSGKTWARIAAKFKRRHSGASERRAIASAMAIYERAGGKASGTSGDRARTQFDSANQLDCIDEAANMTSLLVMLKSAGLLRHNIPVAPSSRSVSNGNRWPHYAGTVKDKRTGKLYVIDSWFRSNAKPAVVVPYKKWKTGWSA